MAGRGGVERKGTGRGCDTPLRPLPPILLICHFQGGEHTVLRLPTARRDFLGSSKTSAPPSTHTALCWLGRVTALDRTPDTKPFQSPPLGFLSFDGHCKGNAGIFFPQSQTSMETFVMSQGGFMLTPQSLQCVVYVFCGHRVPEQTVDTLQKSETLQLCGCTWRFHQKNCNISI